jgi:hypothetical protein
MPNMILRHVQSITRSTATRGGGACDLIFITILRANDHMTNATFSCRVKNIGVGAPSSPAAKNRRPILNLSYCGAHIEDMRVPAIVEYQM